MNQELLTQIPSGFATSVERFEKDVERAADGQAEPDDHWYPVQQKEERKSKLATDPDDGNTAPSCPPIGLSSTNTSPQLMDWEMTAYANDPDGDSLTYDWTFDGRDGPGGCTTTYPPSQKTISGRTSDYDNEDPSTTCNYSVTVSDGQDSCTRSKGATNQCGVGCDKK
jgi:hypothetical protein